MRTTQRQRSTSKAISILLMGPYYGTRDYILYCRDDVEIICLYSVLANSKLLGPHVLQRDRTA